MKYKLFVCVIVLVSVLPSQEVKLDRLFGTTPIGEPCDVNEDCLDFEESTECNPTLDKCYCRETHEPYRPPNGTIICISFVNELGKECFIKSQCTKGVPGDWSDCLPALDDPDKLVCSCVEEAINEPGEHKCYPKRFEVGAQCDINAQCKFNLTDYSECLDNECNCTKSIAIPSPDMKKCLPIINYLFEECTIKEQCTLGVPGLLSDCLEPWQDLKGHLLIDPTLRICNCTEDAIYDPDHSQLSQTCFPRRKLVGEICEVNAQCSVNLGPFSECKNNLCVCLDGQSVPSANNDFCLPIVNEIGGECKEFQQCTEGIPGELSACMNSTTDPIHLVCNCTLEGVAEPGENICLKRADYVGDECEQDLQCKANLGDLSECRQSVQFPYKAWCLCLLNISVASQDARMCLPIVNNVGEPCIESQQCTSGILGPNSNCVLASCQCSEGFELDPETGSCEESDSGPGALIGFPCVSDQDCVGSPGISSGCNIDGICACLGGHLPSKRRDNCLAIQNQLGSTCVEPEQCQRGILGPLSDCSAVRSICECTAFSIAEPGNNFCHRRAALVGDPCQVNIQCEANIGEHSHCIGERCECKRGTVPSSDKSKCVKVDFL